MVTIIKQLTGTAAEIAARVLPARVLVWNETAMRWHGGDGVTAGGIAMARFDERNDGSLGYEQRVETDAANAVTVADIGRVIIGNRATAIAFNLDPAASLTSKFAAIFKNIGAGAMTVVPNGAQLIDGVAAAINVPTGSSVIIKGDGTSFRTFLANGDVTGAAINGATALTGANLADNDKLGVYDASAASLAAMTITEFVAGIFKTARKIANGYFLSSFRLWDASDQTKGLGFVMTAITTATTRLITMPDRDVELGVSIVKSATVATTSGSAIDFTNIPAGAKRVTATLMGVSTSGASDLLIQIGPSGGIETSGYSSHAAYSGGSGAGSTNGFLVQNGLSASDAVAATMTIDLADAATNRWNARGNVNRSVGTSIVGVASGTKALAGALTRLRLTTVGGTDTFDAGSVSISWEF
ncbi:hypothetical protein FVA81_24070 [Rhizobium sp. WL3]|uniref:hypothetical protein n=1 Tax=Rhizobium sp. WL3 TaxID=2603277 RepID=UPI0011C1DDE6|nr:hypothetical protein [Rhizobium sp. WL3]QEE47493.1 hypothetical protein FVA81_24070 [Rhizobium sp. WL3]